MAAIKGQAELINKVKEGSSQPRFSFMKYLTSKNKVTNSPPEVSRADLPKSLY